MKILALDTSTEHCSVALWRDGAVDALDVLAGQRHSEFLLPMVDTLLARHGLAVKELDGIAFGRGPGSFTGLRIGCGVAQGLAFGAGLRVAGIVTLLAMAESSGAPRAVCCLDARMGEIYFAAYERSPAGWEPAYPPGLFAPESAPDLPPGDWTGCGNGFGVHGAALRRRYAGRLSSIMPEVRPRAGEIARLAAAEFAAGRAVAPEQALPLYIRNKVALRTDER